MYVFMLVALLCDGFLDDDGEGKAWAAKSLLNVVRAEDSLRSGPLPRSRGVVGSSASFSACCMVLLVRDIRRLGSSKRAVLLATLGEEDERAARGRGVGALKFACGVFTVEAEALLDANRGPTAGGWEDRNARCKT